VNIVVLVVQSTQQIIHGNIVVIGNGAAARSGLVLKQIDQIGDINIVVVCYMGAV
jgi:hypothetical protein